MNADCSQLVMNCLLNLTILCLVTSWSFIMSAQASPNKYSENGSNLLSKLIVKSEVKIDLVENQSSKGQNYQGQSPAEKERINKMEENTFQTQGGEFFRGCYFTNWAQYRHGMGKYTVSSYQPGLCTHIFYAFASISSEFTLEPIEWNDVTVDWSIGQYEKVISLKKIDSGLKSVILSVGGWNFNNTIFDLMSSTSVNREKFIESSLSKLREWGFDGIDIDWEFPKTKNQKGNFVTLLKEFRTAIESEVRNSIDPMLILTCAVSAGKETIDAAYDIENMAQYVDHVQLMSYDYHGSWEDFTGFNSPLHALYFNDQLNVEYSASYWVSKGMPKSKILIGLPTYGRGWTLRDMKQRGVGAAAVVDSPGSHPQSFTNEAGTIAYYEILKLQQEGGLYYRKDKFKQSYLVKGDQWFSYDDVESFRQKCEWIKSMQFGGAFVWNLDMDDFGGIYSEKAYPLTRVMESVFQGIH